MTDFPPAERAQNRRFGAKSAITLRQMSAHPEPVGLDPVPDRLFAPRHVILVKQPSREFATIEQIAGAALFMCSPAGDQMTGTALSIDGGWTAQ